MHIRELARKQNEARADTIDLNAGQLMDGELEDVLWLIEVVEDELGPDARLVIDTSDPNVMTKAIGECSAFPLMNSISNELSKGR